MALSYPLITWGGGQAASGLTLQNVTLTPGQADVFGGTGAVLLDDTSTVAEAYAKRNFSVTVAGKQRAFWIVKQGTSAQSTLRIYNNTQSNDHLRLQAAWAAGVPTVTSQVGALLGVIALGQGWYFILGESSSAPAVSDLCYWLINPGGNVSTPNLGSTYLDERKLILLDHPQNPIAWRPPRAGTEKVRGLDGGFDTWLTGKDSRFSGEFAWIPSQPRSSPLTVSGYEGFNEISCVNCGVQAFLEAAWAGFTLQWVPDRSDCTTSISGCELVKPFEDDKPEMKANGDRSLVIELLSNGTVPFPMPI